MMRSSDEWWVYVGTVGLFAAVVLWGARVSAPVPLGIAFAGCLLILIGIARARSTSRVLVVGAHGTEIVDLVDEALDEAGYEVVSCDGPGARPCPVEARGVCPVHVPVAGIVIVQDGTANGRMPRCEEALGAPAISVEESGEGLRRFRAALGV